MKLSIITVNYNNAEGLKQTLASVASQSGLGFEHIIVDAASTDGSVDIIRAYEDLLHSNTDVSLFWSSEKDGGIYDGMNKGIRKASGEYLFFLNSGDTFVDDTIIARFYQENVSKDIVIGSINFVSDKGTTVINRPFLGGNQITLYNLYRFGISHQATFIRRSLFEKFGYYNTSLRIVADWEFFVRSLIIGDCSYEFVNMTFVNFDNNGLSANNMDKLLAEWEVAFSQMFPPRIVSDYHSLKEHYGELDRISWLLRHPVFYRVYRLLVAIGRRICK